MASAKPSLPLFLLLREVPLSTGDEGAQISDLALNLRDETSPGFLLLLLFSSMSRCMLRHLDSPIAWYSLILILAPIGYYARAALVEYNHIACPIGYAIEVRPHYYVTCNRIDQYWDGEWKGELVSELEMKDPNIIPITMRRIK